jgi:hypothetical protein
MPANLGVKIISNVSYDRGKRAGEVSASSENYQSLAKLMKMHNLHCEVASKQVHTKQRMFDEGCFPRLKGPGREADNWPPSTAKAENDEVRSPIPHTSFYFLIYSTMSNISLSVLRFSWCYNVDLSSDVCLVERCQRFGDYCFVYVQSTPS